MHAENDVEPAIFRCSLSAFYSQGIKYMVTGKLIASKIHTIVNQSSDISANSLRNVKYCIWFYVLFNIGDLDLHIFTLLLFDQVVLALFKSFLTFLSYQVLYW